MISGFPQQLYTYISISIEESDALYGCKPLFIHSVEHYEWLFKIYYLFPYEFYIPENCLSIIEKNFKQANFCQSFYLHFSWSYYGKIPKEMHEF